MEDTFDGRERRRFVRLEMAVAVSFRFETDESGRPYHGLVKDISEGGLRLIVTDRTSEIVDQFNRENNRTIVDICLDGEGPFRVSGHPRWIRACVEWCREPSRTDATLQVGLQFFELPETERDRIHRYMAEAFAKRYGSKQPGGAELT